LNLAAIRLAILSSPSRSRLPDSTETSCFSVSSSAGFSFAASEARRSSGAATAHAQAALNAANKTARRPKAIAIFIVLKSPKTIFQKHRGTGFAGPLVLPPVGGGRLHEVSQPGGELV